MGRRQSRQGELPEQEKGWDPVDPSKSSTSLFPRSALGPAEGSGEERGQEEALWQKSLNNEEEQLGSPLWS